jgi:hypothetical protein
MTQTKYNLLELASFGEEIVEMRGIGLLITASIMVKTAFEANNWYIHRKSCGEWLSIFINYLIGQDLSGMLKR